MTWDKLFDSLSYKLSIKPPPRRDAAIGHDRERNRVIVFGGRQTNTDTSLASFNMPVLFDDTWEFNLQTSKPVLFGIFVKIYYSVGQRYKKKTLNQVSPHQLN
jgi:hypothetical protein